MYAMTVDAPVVLQGFPGSDYNIAYGVNSVGDVAGVSNLGGIQHVVQWPSGTTVPSDIGMGTPHDINTAGQVAGEFGVHAALWTPDGVGGYTLTNIGAQLPSAITSTAWSINPNGQVVGTYSIAPSDGVAADKCFLWTPDKPNATTGTVRTLPDFGGTHCWANDINSNGYVVGAATNTKEETHGFVWAPSYYGRLPKIRDLTPDGSASYATSINDAGQIAGQHTTETTANAAIWNPTASGSYIITDLGTFTGNQSWALDINDAGFVVGFVSRSDVMGEDAFIWQSGEFTLLPGVTSFNEATALTGLNGNSVQVVGGGYDIGTGARTAVRWNVTLAAPGASAK